jgi:hypothetical protein
LRLRESINDLQPVSPAKLSIRLRPSPSEDMLQIDEFPIEEALLVLFISLRAPGTAGRSSALSLTQSVKHSSISECYSL